MGPWGSSANTKVLGRIEFEVFKPDQRTIASFGLGCLWAFFVT